jgi:hypothetical protein
MQGIIHHELPFQVKYKQQVLQQQQLEDWQELVLEDHSKVYTSDQ